MVLLRKYFQNTSDSKHGMVFKKLQFEDFLARIAFRNLLKTLKRLRIYHILLIGYLDISHNLFNINNYFCS